MIKSFSEWLNLPLGEYDIAKLAYDIERKEIELKEDHKTNMLLRLEDLILWNFIQMRE